MSTILSTVLLTVTWFCAFTKAQEELKLPPKTVFEQAGIVAYDCGLNSTHVSHGWPIDDFIQNDPFKTLEPKMDPVKSEIFSKLVYHLLVSDLIVYPHIFLGDSYKGQFWKLDKGHIFKITCTRTIVMNYE